MSLQLEQKILKRLSDPKIETTINKIINCGKPQVLEDMILFAEWLERRHKRGFVVYWTTAGVPRFELANVEEWNAMYNRPWIGCSHWHTRLCHTSGGGSHG